ncbi:MAG: two-component system phosphate regulon sensor histidine kinase PhoR [Salibacteraceae bacterium]|jgi:two-component system phosphate regulon sensor histidine kinase PhoR
MRIIFSSIQSRKLALLKKDFIHNITQELKTPIANIALASDAARNKTHILNQDKLAKYAQIIYQKNDRLHQLVDRILQISSLEKKPKYPELGRTQNK